MKHKDVFTETLVNIIEKTTQEYNDENIIGDINMCDFCNNIPTLDDYTKILSPYDRYNTIVYNHHTNKYWLWIEIDDWYYSGIKKEIYYCPICGRKLK